MQQYRFAAALLAAVALMITGCPVEPEPEKNETPEINADLIDKWSAEGKQFEIKGDGAFDAQITIAAGSPALPVAGKLRRESGDNYRLLEMSSSEASISGILSTFKNMPVRLTLAPGKETFEFTATGADVNATLANQFFGGVYARGSGAAEHFNAGLFGKWLTADTSKSIQISDTGISANITYSGFRIPVEGSLEYVSGNNYRLKDLATTNASFAVLVKSFKGVVATLTLAEDNGSFGFSVAGTEPEEQDANRFFGGTYLVDASSVYLNPDLVGSWSGPPGGAVTVHSYTINADGSYTADVTTPLGRTDVTGRFAHDNGDQYRLKDMSATNGLVASMMSGFENAVVTLTVLADKQSFEFASQNATIQSYYGGVYTKTGN